MTNLYYKPSGKFTLSGIALGFAGGLINGLVLAFFYSYIISYIPFVYLNFLCTIGYSVLLGFIIGSLMRWGKVRNRWVGVLVAIIVAAVSLYFSWAIWVSVLLGKANINVSALELAQQPGLLWDTISRINEVGAWKIRGLTVSGGFLWFIWIVEAAIILGGTTIAAVGVLSTTPFCESCQSWCHLTKDLMLLGDADSDELKRRMEAKDFDYLKSLGPKKEGQQDWIRVDIYDCTKCGLTNTLSLLREQLTVDKKGKHGKKSVGVMDNLLLSKSDVDRLRQLGQELGKIQIQA
jgi:hypothetical protein